MNASTFYQLISDPTYLLTYLLTYLVRPNQPNGYLLSGSDN